eukprot:g34321.t1
MDVSAKSVTRYGNGEVQEEEGRVRDGPGELKVRVKGVSEVDELFKLLMGEQVSGDAVINVMAEEGNEGKNSGKDRLFVWGNIEYPARLRAKWELRVGVETASGIGIVAWVAVGNLMDNGAGWVQKVGDKIQVS